MNWGDNPYNQNEVPDPQTAKCASLVSRLPDGMRQEYSRRLVSCITSADTERLLHELQTLLNKVTGDSKENDPNQLEQEIGLELDSAQGGLTHHVEENRVAGAGSYGRVYYTDIPGIVAKRPLSIERHLLEVASGESRTYQEEFTIAKIASDALADLEVASVKVLSVDQAGYEITMEEIMGLSLIDICTHPSSFQSTDLLRTINRKKLKEAALHSLNVMHKAGVVHGDIARRNLMFDTDMRLYFIDYGKGRGIKHKPRWEQLRLRKEDERTLKLSLRKFFDDIERKGYF